MHKKCTLLSYQGLLFNANYFSRLDECLIKKKSTLQSLELKNWGLTIRCNLVTYPGHSFWEGVLLLFTWSSQRILSPTDKTFSTFRKQLSCNDQNILISGIFLLFRILVVGWIGIRKSNFKKNIYRHLLFIYMLFIL